MTLQSKIKTDLQSAMKERNEIKKEALRVVMGEMARMDKKELSDDEVIRILKKLVKSEKEMLEKSGQALTSPFIDVIETYLPQMAAEADIRQWIATHIDFGAYKNKMQAMGAIMKHFESSADGNLVKQILQKFPG
jgi:uncharacterized protein YqeY